MRLSLRLKILLLTILTPATLTLANLLTVHRNVSEHVNSSSIHESLNRSAAVFENMLQTRTHALAGGAHVIARDPRFFSLLTLGPAQRDSRFTATVQGVAKDFNRITETDIFDVLDRRGALLASVGTKASSRESRARWVRAALKGELVQTILVEPDAHYQAVVTPVFAGNQIVGVLVLGARIGKSLAEELRGEMYCEVTFLSRGTITGTTLEQPGDREALMGAVRQMASATPDASGMGPVFRVRGQSTTFLTVVRPIPGSDPEARQLYVMQRSFDPESAFLHVMQQDVLALALIAMAMAVVTGLLFGEYILRPLQLLVRGAREMEKGNYDYPLGGKRNDELGYVVSRFAFMRQRERAYLGSLEQVGRLKSQFLSVAAHELRTPISVLVAYRDVLADGQLGPVTEQQREALETMRENLTRMTRLADDAARFAGVKSERLAYEFQPENVESIVRHAVTTAQAAGAGRSVNIEAACDPIRDEVEADAESLEHAIVQLITNGIRFTPDGGHVVAHAREVDGRLHIEVKDSGVGLSAEKLETLLAHGATAIEINHYRSATGLEFNSPGMGLGLSVARAIVEAHGGILRAESRPGEGSTFVLELPMKRPLDLASAA